MAALTLAQQIADAQAAYHELLVGRSARVVIDANGEQVTYTPANRAALAAYIERLLSEQAGRPTTNVVKFQTSKGT